MKKLSHKYQPSAGFHFVELILALTLVATLSIISTLRFGEQYSQASLSRAKENLGRIGVALEAYAVDFGQYPPAMDYPNNFEWIPANGGSFGPPFHARVPSYLTTPIAYMTTLPDDPFKATAHSLGGFLEPFSRRQIYFNFPYFQAVLTSYDGSTIERASRTSGDWLLYSVGPDEDEFNQGAPETIYLDYDPTNGTMSVGNIFHTQKKIGDFGVLPAP